MTYSSLVSSKSFALCLVACAASLLPTRATALTPSGDESSFARPNSRGTVSAFDPSGNLVTGGALQSRDGALTKFSPRGDILWTQKFSSPQLVDISAVAADRFGNFYVAGAFEKQLTVAGTRLSGGPRPSIFMAKFGPDGAVLWANAFRGKGYNAARGIATDAEGNIYVTGTYQDAISFGGDTLQANVFRDVFTASFDPNGQHRWSLGFHAHGPVETTGSAIAVDDKMVYVAGLTESDFTFSENGANSGHGSQLFVVGMARDGHLLFRKIVKGAGASRANGIASAGPHGFTVVGEFADSINVEGTELKSAGATDALLVHFDSGGAFAWSKRFGGAGWDKATSVVMGPDGTSYVAAAVTDGIDLGAPDTGRGGKDALVAAIDEQGALKWVRRYGGEGDDDALSIARSGEGSLAVAGGFARSISAGDSMSLSATVAPSGFAFRFAGSTPPGIEVPKVVVSADPVRATEQALAAAERGDVDTLSKIVPSQVKGDATDSQGWPMVMKAAFKGKAEAVKYLCAHGANPNASLPSGYTPLMQAVRWGYLDAAKALVEGGAKLDAADGKNGTALHVVLREAKNASDIVSYLIAQKAPLEAKDSRGRTPLLVAIEANNEAGAKLLLDAKADAKAADETGYSALGRAATGEHETLVTELLKRGADPNVANDHGWSAVTDAAHKGNVAIVTALLAKGGNPNGPKFAKPMSRPITLAAQAGHTAVVELLLDKGARVNEVDDNGWTAAHHAARGGKINVLKVLKKHGADYTIKNKDGQTVIDVAEAGYTKNFVSGTVQ